MTQRKDSNLPGKERNVFDYLLYALAGSVLLTVSFSFLLWLRF